MHSIGTAAVVVQVTGTNWPKPAYTLLVTGLCRFRLQELLQETPFPVATVTQLDKLPEDLGILYIQTVQPVYFDTCIIHFPMLSEIDFHALLTIFDMFCTVQLDTLSILTPSFSPAACRIRQDSQYKHIAWYTRFLHRVRHETGKISLP